MTSRAETEYRYEKLTWPEINDAVDLGKVARKRRRMRPVVQHERAVATESPDEQAQLEQDVVTSHWSFGTPSDDQVVSGQNQNRKIESFEGKDE